MKSLEIKLPDKLMLPATFFVVTNFIAHKI